jgi:hypothetical protein
MKRTTLIFLCILTIAIALRLPGLNNQLFGDEIQWARFYCTGQYWFSDIGHPSLAGWGTNLSCLLFGVSAWSIRLPMFVIGLLLILVTWLYGRKLFSEKTGLFAAAILAISAWAVMSTLAVTSDSSYLTFFFTTALLSYLCWLKKPERIHFVIMILSIGLGFITKSAAVIILAIIAVHQLLLVLLKKQKINQCLKLWPLVLSFVIPLLYYFIQFATDATTYTSYTKYRILHKLLFTSGVGFQFPLSSWVLAFILASPFLVALLALNWRTIFNTKHVLLWLWMMVPSIVYSTVIVNNNIERFMPIALAPIALLAGDYLEKHWVSLISLWKKHRALALTAIVLPAIVLALSYFLPDDPQIIPVPYYEASAYLSPLAQGATFFFPIISDMGPTYYVHSAFLIASSVLAALLLCVALIVNKRRNFFAIIIVMLLSAGIAFNLLLISEQHFALKGPSVYALAENADKELSTIIKPNDSVLVIGAHFVSYPWKNLNKGSILSSKPADLNMLYLAINATEGGTYSDKETNATITKAGIILLRSDADFDELAGRIHGHNIVLFENYPPLPGNNTLKRALSGCTLLKSLSHRGLKFTFHDCSQ